MTTGRNCDKMTDISTQMMGNLSEKRLPVRSSQHTMNHDIRMDIRKSTGLGNSTESKYLDIFIRCHRKLWSKDGNYETGLIEG